MLPQTHLALSLLLSCKKHAIFFGFFLVYFIPESIKFSVKSAKVWEICFCLSGSRSLSQHRLKKWGAQNKEETNHHKSSTSTRTHTISQKTRLLFSNADGGWLWGNYFCSPPLIAVSIGWIAPHTAVTHFSPSDSVRSKIYLEFAGARRTERFAGG